MAASVYDSYTIESECRIPLDAFNAHQVHTIHPHVKFHFEDNKLYISTATSNGLVHVLIVRLERERTDEKIVAEFMLQGGDGPFLTGIADKCTGYVVLRSLKMRNVESSSYCPPMANVERDRVLFVVQGQIFEVSATALMCISQTFGRVFTEMQEMGLRSVHISDVAPEDFHSFLACTNFTSLNPLKPHPYNVQQLLSLAERFNVQMLKKRCEDQLICCAEISMKERVLLSDKYQLDRLLDDILDLLAEGLKQFCKNNQYMINKMSDWTLHKILIRLANGSDLAKGLANHFTSGSTRTVRDLKRLLDILINGNGMVNFVKQREVSTSWTC